MAVPTIQDIVSSMARGQTGWSSSTVTFSFPTLTSTWSGYAAGSEPYRAAFRPFSATEADLFRKAIASYDKYVAVNFKEVQEPGDLGAIRIAVTSHGGSGASGWANYPGESAVAGDIWIDAQYGPNFYLLLHELGHALGLSHPNDPGTLLPADFQSLRYSVLAGYRPQSALTVEASGNTIKTNWTPLEVAGPSLYDVLTLQTLYGADPETGKGDTAYKLDAPLAMNLVLYDASGVDTLDTSDNQRSSEIDLEPGSFSSIGKFSRDDQIKTYSALHPSVDWTSWLSATSQPSLYTWTNNVSIAFGTIIENAIGGAAADLISGNNVANNLTGQGGDDVLNGRGGVDTAVFTGLSSEYTWRKGNDGRWTVKDLRAGRDGIDTLENIEILRFSDKSVALPGALSQKLETAFLSVLRASSSANANAELASDLQLKIYAGISEASAIATIVDAADATTSVASMSYQFFTGKIPTLLGFDFLVSPTGGNTGNLNSDLYAKFNIVNRHINFAMNLGKYGEAKDSFAAEYGSLTLFEATRKAYGVIFGSTPNDEKVTQLLNGRVDFLASFSGDPAEGIGTKAAMVGFLLAAAATENVGVIARSNDAWLMDLTDGSAPYAVDILDPGRGYYKADFIFGGP